MIFGLLLAALVVAALLAAFGGRFEITKPAVILLATGMAGAVIFSIATMSGGEGAAFVAAMVLGPFLLLVAVVGLLSLAILWAYRRWSGFHQEHPK